MTGFVTTAARYADAVQLPQAINEAHFNGRRWCTHINNAQATEAGVGCSSFTSVGNEAEAEFSDFVGYLLDAPETQVIGGYLEGARDGDKLRRVAEKALQLQKPMLMRV